MRRTLFILLMWAVSLAASAMDWYKTDMMSFLLSGKQNSVMVRCMVTKTSYDGDQVIFTIRDDDGTTTHDLQAGGMVTVTFGYGEREEWQVGIIPEYEDTSFYISNPADFIKMLRLCSQFSVKIPISGDRPHTFFFRADNPLSW